MNDKNITVVIPAYNESQNINYVIKAIRKEFPKSRIIVVDDSNKSESKKTYIAISKFDRLEFFPRSAKMGRGSAVLFGFKKALQHKDAQYIFEMDADQSHEPTHLKRFLDNIVMTRAEMVVGSRYIKNGNTGQVSLPRKVLSRLINKFLSIILEVKLSDYTSGFRLYSRKAVQFLSGQEFRSTGFITLSEITFKLTRNDFKISEVPVTITNRKYGKSNMGISELIKSLVFIVKLKLDYK